MGRKKNSAPVVSSKFTREYSMLVNGFEVVRGDIIKVSGEYGLKFKFDAVVTNMETGSTWVDCFELFRGQSHSYRSFALDRVKRIPQKGKRAKKNVSED